VERAPEAGLCKGELVDEEGDDVCGCRELEREGLSGEEGDGAMGVREKKMGCGVAVAAVFCVM